MTLIHISVGGPTRLIVDAKNRLWHFEDHPHCGPVVRDRKDNIEADQPPESSSFWTAVTYWYQQGKVISDNGLCVWVTPLKLKIVHLGGRHYALEGGKLALQKEASNG